MKAFLGEAATAAVWRRDSCRLGLRVLRCASAKDLQIGEAFLASPSPKPSPDHVKSQIRLWAIDRSVHYGCPKTRLATHTAATATLNHKKKQQNKSAGRPSNAARVPQSCPRHQGDAPKLKPRKAKKADPPPPGGGQAQESSASLGGLSMPPPVA
jgi:hypothetical protein